MEIKPIAEPDLLHVLTRQHIELERLLTPDRDRRLRELLHYQERAEFTKPDGSFAIDPEEAVRRALAFWGRPLTSKLGVFRAPRRST